MRDQKGTVLNGVMLIMRAAIIKGLITLCPVVDGQQWVFLITVVVSQDNVLSMAIGHSMYHYVRYTRICVLLSVLSFANASYRHLTCTLTSSV